MWNARKLGRLLLSLVLLSLACAAPGWAGGEFNLEDAWCATPEAALLKSLDAAALADPSDCSFTGSNPSADYDPTVLYTVPVVVHVIQDSSCTDGAVSDAMVQSQIDILNEDSLALAGTPGANGTDAQIRFELATEDPLGNPTNGITRHCNDTWYNDGGNYWETLSWDPHNYMNLYTNTAGGARGYVTVLPAQSGGNDVGNIDDRVVVNWLVFGRNSPFIPHDQGRTATHEAGHYLGLFHPYFGGCGVATAPDCYSTGDLLCDTPPDEASTDLCPVGATSCGGVPIPIENYMELTDDLCMEGFTLEQVRRMRCSLESYRPDLFQVTLGTCGNGVKEGSEECDGGDLGGATCSDVGCSSGSVSCTVGCTLDYSACSSCSVCDFDGVCETGEDCNGCASDCISGSASSAACGNGICEAADGEDCSTCAADCDGRQGGPPSGRFCCGAAGEGCSASGCNSGGFSCTTLPAPTSSYCCGDSVCEGAETGTNCGVDCGGPVCGQPGDACNDPMDCCSLTCKGNGTCR